MIRERAGNTENQDFKLRNTEIHFIGTSGRLPTGKASIFTRMQKLCAHKPGPLFAFDFDMVRIPSPYTLLRLIKLYNYSSLVK